MTPAGEPAGGTGLRLDLLPEPFALLRMPAGSEVPAWTSAARHFLTISRTPTELSIVADSAVVPAGVAAERDFRAFRVHGPMPLHLVGVIAALAPPLAQAGVPIFPIATHDTDYLLVREADVARAQAALVAAGHRVVTSEGGGTGG